LFETTPQKLNKSHNEFVTGGNVQCSGHGKNGRKERDDPEILKVWDSTLRMCGCGDLTGDRDEFD